MIKKNKIISIILVFALMLSLAGTALASDTEFDRDKIITEAYIYPVRPGSEEWTKFESRAEKIKACQIPEFMLSRMTTEALVESVMGYPLLIDMVVRDTKREGFEAILEVFNGLQELMKRPDGLDKLNNYSNKMDAVKTRDKKIILKEGYIEYIFIGLEPNRSELVISSKSSVGTVYTPNDTPVSTYKDLVWSDHGLTSALADYYDDEISKAYPNATQLRQEDSSYNCHSYAWHSTSFFNRHWIDDPAAYMTVGNYSSGTGQVGSKVWYGNGGHSGIITYVGGGSGPNINVISKWGALGLYSHNIVDCPYTTGSYSCTFWN